MDKQKLTGAYYVLRKKSNGAIFCHYRDGNYFVRLESPHCFLYAVHFHYADAYRFHSAMEHDCTLKQNGSRRKRPERIDPNNYEFVKVEATFVLTPIPNSENLWEDEHQQGLRWADAWESDVTGPVQ